MRTRLLVLVALVVGLAAAAHAQTTVPEPRRTVIVDDPVDPANTAAGSEWLMVYPPTAPAPLPGTPYLAAWRITLTPTSGTTTPRVVTVPRAGITRETTAARCPSGATPCLRADGVSLPIGAWSLRVAFVDGQGLEGGSSDPVPFSGAFPRPSAPRVPRVLPE